MEVKAIDPCLQSAGRPTLTANPFEIALLGCLWASKPELSTEDPFQAEAVDWDSNSHSDRGLPPNQWRPTSVPWIPSRLIPHAWFPLLQNQSPGGSGHGLRPVFAHWTLANAI